MRGRDGVAGTMSGSENIFQSTRPVRGRDGAGAPPIYSERNFNPRAPCGGATGSEVTYGRYDKDFNPRAPCGGATRYFGVPLYKLQISIHAPRAGARQHVADSIKPGKVFQSTRPVRGRD